MLTSMFAQDRAGDVCRNSKNGPSAPILGIVTGDPQVTHEKLFDMAHAIIGHQVTIQEFRRRMISEVCNINFEVWGERKKAADTPLRSIVLMNCCCLNRLTF